MPRALRSLCLALLATSAFAADAVLLDESFADLHRWGSPPGWKLQDGGLLAGGGGIQVCREGRDWRDYALDFDTVIRHGMAQWVVRAASERDCIFIQLTTQDNAYSPNSLRLHTWRDGQLGKIMEIPVPVEIEAGKPYHIRTECLGPSLQVVIDGRVRAQWTIAGYDHGTVGFRASDAEQALYRNLRVTAISGFTPLPARPAAKTKVVATEPFLNPPFRAEWIWGPSDALDRAFRTSFTLGADPVDARLWITCDNAFHLFVNGQEAGSGDDWNAPVLLDLKRFLRRGPNVLAVAAHNDGPGAAGVLAEGNILVADGTNLPLVSSPAWKTSDKPADGWREPGFEDRAWAPATSLGRHPQAPWAGQVDWRLPYLGPLELATAMGVQVEGTLGPRRPVRLTLGIRLDKALTQRHPVRVSAALPGGRELTIAEGYTGLDAWPAGTRSLKLEVPAVPTAWLPAGKHRLRVELVGVYAGAGWTTEATWAEPPRREPLPLSRRPMRPGLFTDQFGGAHSYRWDGDWLVYDNERLAPLDHGGGAWWCLDDPASRSAIEAARSAGVLARVRRDGLTEEPIRLRLLDSIECADPASEKAHEFGEDDGFGGKSRLLTIGGKVFRVTDNRRRLSYFAYTMRALHPGRPHVLVFETPNDRERYTLVRIQPPWRNVGCGPFTGRQWSLDGRAYQAGFVFYPEDTDIRLTVSRLPCELKIEPESGGAVSRLWLFEVADELADRPAETVPTTGPSRRIGLSLTHPAYLYDLYGQRDGDLSRRMTSLQAFVDYAGFAGLNHFEFNAINGADTSEVAYYPSQSFPQYHGDRDLFAELLPLAQARGLSVIPCLTSLAFDIERYTSAPWISPLTFQIDQDGWRQRDFFRGRGNANTLPDPLRPEVQRVFLDTLEELARQAKDRPGVTGVAFRLNGKIGTCYVGYNEDEQAATAGYSPWDLAEFQRDTHVAIPRWDPALVDRWVTAVRAGRKDDPAVKFIPTAAAWLRANAWEPWLDWRCRRMTQLWTTARDRIRAIRPDLNLVIKCDMPSETPDRNILWPKGVPPLQLFREHGFDPRMLKDEPGIVLQQGYFLGGGEYFHAFGPSNRYAANPEAWEAFDAQPGLAELYRTQAGTSVELYHNYWEENGAAPLGEFRTSFWGAGMMYPRGRAYFHSLLQALRLANARTLALFSWERGSEGHEGELRRFTRAFRALPAVDPAPFDGPLTVTAGPAADATLWVRRFGDRLALVNDADAPRTVQVTLPAAPGEAVYELAGQRRLGTPGEAVTVELEPFDLRVLGVE